MPKHPTGFGGNRGPKGFRVHKFTSQNLADTLNLSLRAYNRHKNNKLVDPNNLVSIINYYNLRVKQGKIPVLVA